MDWSPVSGNSTHPDVLYAIRAEIVRFRGRSDYRVAIIPALDLNRNLAAHHVTWNLALVFATHGP